MNHHQAANLDLSDRVLVLEADPGRLRAEIPIALPRPHHRDHADTAATVADVRQALHAAHAF